MRGRETSLQSLSNKEIGYLISLFIGDGYAYYHKTSRHYTVEFFLNSKKDLDIVNFLCIILRKIGANPLIYQDKRYNSLRVRVNSKEFYNFITSFDLYSQNSEEFKIGFISGFIDAEGYINASKRMIQIVNTNRKIMEIIETYLQELNIISNLSKRKKSSKDKLTSYSLYIPVKFINLRNNSIKLQRYKRALTIK